MSELQAILRFDGGAKPGRATAGAVLTTNDGRTIAHIGALLGDETNNVAEHTALSIGLELAAASGITHLRAFGDSELVLGQVFKGWGAQGKLAVLAERSREISRAFESFAYRYAPRELNAAPDSICHAVENEWYLPPGDLLPDGTAHLGFVAAVEVPASELADIKRRNGLKSEIRERVERATPLALERTVARTNADPHVNDATGLGIVTYVVRLHIGAVTAAAPDRRVDIEAELLATLAAMPIATRARLTRISG